MNRLEKEIRRIAGYILRSQGGPGYLVYTALLTQTGTNAPVVTAYENTLGATVTWTRASEGVYSGRVPVANIFADLDKIAIPGIGAGPGPSVYLGIGMPLHHAYTVYCYEDFNGDGIIELAFVDSTGVVKDISTSGSTTLFIEIRVYP